MLGKKISTVIGLISTTRIYNLTLKVQNIQVIETQITRTNWSTYSSKRIIFNLPSRLSEKKKNAIIYTDCKNAMRFWGVVHQVEIIFSFTVFYLALPAWVIWLLSISCPFRMELMNTLKWVSPLDFEMVCWFGHSWIAVDISLCISPL